ncbi:hypothetical protein SAMN05421772_1531 [Paracoccus saliphilus]|uniref:Uncharacterized protein n=1 Tax=Paracoccus saliphilus TaxID=405559 RepID=A0AA46A7V9_9RHOB|nr:hypothetical protein SAMN05421772_1531 [Paracoccus saliphilus]
MDIGADQAGIDGKALTADQAMGNALGNHALEDVTEDIAVAELAMSKLRETRVIRHRVLESEPAEPAISEVEVNFLADTPLGPQPHDIADHQHPDHEFRIDRGSTGVAVETAHLLVQTGQIQEAVNTPKEMVGGMCVSRSNS